ncbi:MAG: hypothetical protein RI958_2428 [Actinomycetota bacterium]
MYRIPSTIAPGSFRTLIEFFPDARGSHRIDPAERRSWYAVHVSPDGSTCPLNVEAEQAPVTLAGQVIAVIRPTATATEVSCAFDSQSDKSKEYFTATRPI